MKYEDYFAVIMAGGGGTRLWPLSRQNRPKQSLSLYGEESMFQTSILRLKPLFPIERILVVTVQNQVDLLREQMPEIPLENYIIEPSPRGTASVVGLAAVALRAINPDAVMAVLTADHFIENTHRFLQLLSAGYQAARDDKLVTLGIKPSFPSTGYGYIQRGDRIGAFLGEDVFHVNRFTEKPDEQTAIQMLASGEYSWNSGMFIWKVGKILAEIDYHMPSLSKGLKEIGQNWSTEGQQKVVERVWSRLEAQTIDYGVMEHASDVVVILAANLGWSDVGSWDSLYQLLPKDEFGNHFRAVSPVQLNTKNSMVFQYESDRLVVTIGIEDCVIVDTGDVIMVCKRSHAQDVKKVVELIKEVNPKVL